MGKTSDITGTFRVPEEAWGKFWNLMLTIPGADITPNVRGPAPEKAKREVGKASEGSTGKCVVLAALKNVAHMTASQVTEMLVKHGKSAKSAPNVLYELKGKKQIKQTPKGYALTPAGLTFLRENCPVNRKGAL